MRRNVDLAEMREKETGGQVQPTELEPCKEKYSAMRGHHWVKSRGYSLGSVMIIPKASSTCRIKTPANNKKHLEK